MKKTNRFILILFLTMLLAVVLPVSAFAEEGLPGGAVDAGSAEMVSAGEDPVSGSSAAGGPDASSEEPGPGPEAEDAGKDPETDGASSVSAEGVTAVSEPEVPESPAQMEEPAAVSGPEDTGDAPADDVEEAEPEETLETEAEEADPAVPDILYRTHVQTHGWMQEVSNGELSGTTGESKRLEAIRIRTGSGSGLGVSYQTHVQSYGWMDWVNTNAVSGTVGKGKRLEAIRIKLTGRNKDKYDVYYCVHVQSYGWMNWVKNGASAGTVGQGKRLEGIRILLVKKGAPAPGIPGIPQTDRTAASVLYRVHVQTYGWMNAAADGAIAGTQGQSKRLEAMTVELKNAPYPGSIQYRTHIQGSGWESQWRGAGAQSGTTGSGKRLEALQIRLTGEMGRRYDIYYRTHVQRFGWLGWAKNGESAGTEGFSFRMEALQICLVPKGKTAPGTTKNAFRSLRPPMLDSLNSASGSRTISAFGGFSLSRSLRSRLQSAVDAAQAGGKHVGFVMMDIRTGKGVVYNADERFYSASTIKGPYVASVVCRDPNSIKKWGTTMQQILQQSSNSGYESLRKAYASGPIENWARFAGIPASRVKGSLFIWYSPRELAKLWLVNYQYFQTGGAAETVASWMQSPNISVIKPVLGKRYTTRSKAGWINTHNKSFNDAGIVYANNGPYVIAVMTNYQAAGNASRLHPLIEALEACHQAVK